jgi:hypothetical protein
LGGFGDNSIHDLGRDPGCASRPGRILQKPLDATLDEPATPQRRQLRGAEPTRSRNDFVFVITDSADEQRLQDSLRRKARGQLIEAVLIESAAWVGG